MLACSLLSTLAFALLFFSPFLITYLQRRAATSWSCGRQSHAPQPLSRKGASPLPRLGQHPVLFGLDILYQDFRDLHNHNPSNCLLARYNAHGQTYLSTHLGQSFADYEKGGWAQTVAKYIDGDAWHASGALLKPLFKRNRAADVRVLEPHACRRVDYLRARQGAFVDFRQAAQMVVLDAITEMLTGESALSLASSISASTKGKESGYSTEGAALLDLIDELEP